MAKTLFDQIIAAFQPGTGVHIRDLNQESDLYKSAKAVQDTFTDGVLFLKTNFPNDRIQSLSATIWDLFHHRHSVLTFGPGVSTLTAAMYKNANGVVQSMVIAPHDWVGMVHADPIMQLGAIIMIGSQVVDTYNKRYTVEGIDKIKNRASAYEAEFLRTLQPETPNEYQKHILRTHPKFLPEYEYERKPVYGLN